LTVKFDGIQISPYPLKPFYRQAEKHDDGKNNQQVIEYVDYSLKKEAILA